MNAAKGRAIAAAMNVGSPVRGQSLLRGAARFNRGAGRLARLFAPSFHKILDRIDAGLATGSITGALPDGTIRRLGGRAPGFDAEIVIHDWRALLRLVTNGSVGWYQGWEAGEWSSPDPVPIFALFTANGETLGSAARAKGPFRWLLGAAHRLNRNSRRGSARNIGAHYDLGNDFYSEWLDPSMTYSSALGTAGRPLEAAQQVKMEAIRDRIAGAGSVLEIGCGWGAMAQALADAGAGVTAISLSDEQLRWARAHRSAAIDFQKRDYRDIAGTYDAVVSVEMVEALGRENWPVFLDAVARCLRPGGRAALQFISMRDELFDAYAASADFIQAYIFPGGLLLRTSEFRRLAEERGFEWRDQTDFGRDYADTLLAWRQRFDAAVERGALAPGFDTRFIDLWRYYLMYCEGGFRGGAIDVHQVTLLKR